MRAHLNYSIPLLTTLCAMLCTAAISPAHAQQNDDIVLPEIVIFAHHTRVEASKVGSAVSIITHQDMRERGHISVAEALRSEPSMAFSSYGGAGSFSQLRLRGSDSNHTLVLIDGVNVNAVGDGDFDFANLPTADIDRIEIIRGPQSGLYGSNAHAGVISIVTKSGRGQTKPSAFLNLEGGTRGSFNFSTGVRGAMGPFYGNLSVSGLTTNGYNIARIGTENDGARTATINGRLGVELAPNVILETMVHIYRNRNEFDGFTNSGFTTDAYAQQTTARTMGQAKLMWSMLDGQLNNETEVSYLYHNIDNINGHKWSFSSNAERVSASHKSSYKFSTEQILPLKHTLTGLMSFEQERFVFDSEFYLPNSPWRQRQTRSVGGEYIVELPHGVSLSAALRHDMNDSIKDYTTWRTTAAWRLFDWGTKLHASIGTGVTKPTFYDLYCFCSDGFASFVGNPSLKPERTRGFDIGIEQAFWNNRISADFTYFSAAQKDKILLDYSAYPTVTSRNLAGSSDRQGIELTGKIQPLQHITLGARYTWLISETAEGLLEYRTPRHTAGFDARYVFDEGKGKIGATLDWRGNSRDLSFTTFPSSRITLQHATRVGLHASYEVSKGVEIYARAENALNKKYEEVFTYRAPGASVYAGVRMSLGE